MKFKSIIMSYVAKGRAVTLFLILDALISESWRSPSQFSQMGITAKISVEHLSMFFRERYANCCRND